MRILQNKKVNIYKTIGYISCLLILYVKAHEGYMYPVGSVYHEGILKLAILHQKKNSLDLYFWDTDTGKATPGLLSFYEPLSFTAVPNLKAFSFINNDRIRIKEIEKRSFKSLDLFGPYDFTTISWIDSKSFYFSAKERHHNNIFHATSEGDLLRLTVSNDSHYVYPCKIDNMLFYIETIEDGSQSIKYTSYPLEQIEKYLQENKKCISFEEEFKHLIQEEKKESRQYKPFIDVKNVTTALNFSDNFLPNTSIAFLSMQNPTTGFFISHALQIEHNASFIACNYFLFNYTEQAGWHYSLLFTFTLPLYLILPYKNEITLDESILPLLPKVYKKDIYYSSYDVVTHSLHIYRYNLEEGTKTQCTYGNNKMYWSPYLHKDTLYYGGKIINDCTNEPTMQLDEHGFHYFTLPNL